MSKTDQKATLSAKALADSLSEEEFIAKYMTPTVNAEEKKIVKPAVVDVLDVPEVPIPTEDKEIVDKYIAFRSDPFNLRFEDSKFCSENGISVDRLNKLKTMDVEKLIHSKPLTEMHMRSTVEQLMLLLHKIVIREDAPVKSLEGAVNAFTNLYKQHRLQMGQPTEIIDIESMEKRPVEEVQQSLLSTLRFVGKDM